MANKDTIPKKPPKKKGYVRHEAQHDTPGEVFRSLQSHPMVNIKGRRAPYSLRDTIFFAGVLTKHLMDAMLNGATIEIHFPDRKVELIDVGFTFDDISEGGS